MGTHSKDCKILCTSCAPTFQLLCSLNIMPYYFTVMSYVGYTGFISGYAVSYLY